MIIGDGGRRSGPSRIGAGVALLGFLGQLDRHRAGWLCVQVRLSLLKPYNRREHHLRAAASCFEGVSRRFEGETFMLATGDIIFLCKSAVPDDIEPVVQRLRNLFAEDPLVYQEKAGGSEICIWYDLEFDYERLVAVAREAAQHDQPVAAKPGHSRRSVPSEPLDASRLGRITEALASADLANVIRRQPVCRLAPSSGRPEPWFYEIFVSIMVLRQVMAPEFDLLSNRWLFQHLTEVLDRRVLVAVPKLGSDIIHGHFSLNLNVATLLSSDFTTFERAMPIEARANVIIELQPVDVLSDLDLFVFARDVAHERGYRLCLDGLTQSTFGLLDREGLGFDIIKLQWSSKLLDDPRDRQRGQIEEVVQRTGPANVILCRCDSDEAIALGQRVGITTFQGYRVDAMMQAHRAQPGARKPTPAHG